MIYIPRFMGGAINMIPAIRMMDISKISATVDGNDGLGHLVGLKAMEKEIELARHCGLGLVNAINSDHFGAAGYFSTLATESKMIGLSVSNIEPCIPAMSGVLPVVGNSPFSIAIPSEDDLPICLDVSTRVAAFGKILQSARKGLPIPDYWALDKFSQHQCHGDVV
jgi:LDH2 family malate/lactate/ureidoglycolate dehydrogenase